MRLGKTLFVITVSILLSAMLGKIAQAQSLIEKSLIAKSRLHNPIWQHHSPHSTIKVSHQPWDAFLQTYVLTDVAGVNRVNYSGVSHEDKKSLSSYLTALQRIDVKTLNRDEQFAYWLNLYNASVVNVVLENYPVKSILKIKTNPLDLKGPFNDQIAKVNGLTLTLDTIESGIVRPIWRDARLHYAFNCGAVGCPNLKNSAYQADALDAQLEEAARNYVNDQRGFSAKGSQAVLSKIYFWYSEDFGNDEKGLRAHLLRYANDNTKERIDKIKSRYKYSYDWALNDTRSR